MGIITVEQIVFADGFAADADGGLDFTDVVPFDDDARTDTAQMRWLETVDAILLGRRTYETFAAYWPTADPATDAVAGPIAALPKHVVPVLIGAGRGFSPANAGPRPLRLRDVERLDTGHLTLSYGLDAAPDDSAT